MKILWNSETLKKITNGKINENWTVSGFSIDTRSLKQGDLFCALEGTKFDGHEFLEDAFTKGAKAVLISKTKNLKNKFPYLKVKNVLKALEKIARYIRLNSNAKFISITGSVGKTGTKEMLRTALQTTVKVYANEGSHNNHIGLPLSLCRMPKNTNFCILELGMNKSGEIKKLSDICLPETAIITAIENSHLEGLKTLRKIALAKCEILMKLPESGCCIFNLDTNFSNLILKKAKERKLRNIITYGRTEKADIRLEKITSEKNYYFVEVKIFDKKIAWKMPKLGEHWILNSLSVIAVAYHYNFDLKKVALGISNYKIPNGRGNKKDIYLNKKKITVINDSYNSNPASLKASLVEFKKMSCSKRKIAVLGDMLELGKDSLKYHLNLKNEIIETGIDILFTKGKYMKKVFHEIPKNIEKYHFEDINELNKKIKKIISEGDTVLIKGSNSVGLRKLINYFERNT